MATMGVAGTAEPGCVGQYRGAHPSITELALYLRAESTAWHT